MPWCRKAYISSKRSRPTSNSSPSQTTPCETQTSKKGQRVGREGTGTRKKNPFTFLELHRSQMSTSKPRQGRLESPGTTARYSPGRLAGGRGAT
ncbi:hypothetical protein TNCV_298821 [Trichonephila clavipes]|nr:hypothetical protein TNCV_298821 [Trichonephila clavipes]